MITTKAQITIIPEGTCIMIELELGIQLLIKVLETDIERLKDAGVARMSYAEWARKSVEIKKKNPQDINRSESNN